MPSRSPQAVIIGAGIGGLTLALLLQRRGIDAEVLEQSAELGEVGAAVALYANGTRVLQHLGLGESLAEVSAEPTRLTYRDGRDGHLIAATARYPVVPRHVRRASFRPASKGAAADARGRARA